MTRLIVGAGHVGRALLAQWVAEGHRPYATTRSASKAAELEAAGAQPVICDVMRPETLAALPQVDVAVWSLGHDRSAPDSIDSVYVTGLSYVLDRLRCRRVLYTSSTGVYGPSESGEVDEASPLAPADPGGRAVVRAESVLRERRPDAIVLRLAGLYGPDRIIGKKLVEDGAPMDADPDGWINFIHHEDAAAAVALAAERAKDGATYNVVDTRPMRRREYYGLLAQLLGRPELRFAPSAAPRPSRRVRGEALRSELGFTLRWPTVAEGLPASLAGTRK